MSEVVKDAATYPAPSSADGDVIVLATVATARAAQELVPVTDHPKRFIFEIEADGLDLYLTFGDSSVAAPDSTAVSGSSRAVKIAAGTSKQMAFWYPERTHFRDISSGTTGHIRVYKASPGVSSR